jgi:hypothetical protein
MVVRQLELKIRNMNWLINTKSQLFLENKITMCKAIIKPVWTYGIELWGCIPYVTEVIRTYAKNHKNRTAQNNNQLIRDLFNQPEIRRRLNRMWPEDHIR